MCTHVACVFLHVTQLVLVAESVVVCSYLGGLPLLAEEETESQWLQDTGLSDLLGGLGLDSHHRGFLSTLTQTQVAAVRRRLNIYTRSARRRHKAPVRDVRDIFEGFSSGVSPQHKGDCRRCLLGPFTSCVKLVLLQGCAGERLHATVSPCCRQDCPLCVPLCMSCGHGVCLPGPESLGSPYITTVRTIIVCFYQLYILPTLVT